MTGCLVLLRDVTDVRRLDRLLLSKDAAIREVHHRVKNNLQTISALLRLQARRLPPGGGRVALFEAERRVRSIAIVHEILSRDPGDQVPFDEIVTSLIRMAEDSVVLSRPLTFEVIGELGEVPADVATPLAVVLAELLQNAVEHAFPDVRRRTGEAGHGGRRPPVGAHPGPPGQRPGEPDPRGHRRRLGPARGLRHRRDPEPGAVHRPRPGPQSAGRHHHHAQPPRRPIRQGQRWWPSSSRPEVPRARRPSGCGPSAAGRSEPDGAAQDARRRAASQALRSLRRSSSEVPPQTPDSWLVARAKSRHGSRASQPAADPLGRLDLVDGRPGRPDGEEEIGLGTAAGRQMPPITVVPFDRTVPHQSHADPSALVFVPSEIPVCDHFHIARRQIVTGRSGFVH